MMQEKFSWITWLSQEIHDLSTSIHKVIHINHRRLGKSQQKTFAFSGEKRKKTDDSLLNRPRWSVGFVSQRTRFRVVGRGNSESASVGFSSKRRTSSVL